MGSSYAAYMTTKRNGRRYMVYAGANDGMLHAFDGGMGADGQMDADGGKERFAYIPSTALGHMGNLLLPNDPTNQNAQRFQHRYYVDGPVTISDTYGSNGWTTSLVGTAGAGGRSVFALNVSDPGNFGATGSCCGRSVTSTLRLTMLCAPTSAMCWQAGDRAGEERRRFGGLQGDLR